MSILGRASARKLVASAFEETAEQWERRAVPLLQDLVNMKEFASKVFKRCERINVTYFSLPMSVDQELDFRQHQEAVIEMYKVSCQHNHKIQTEYAKIRELFNILRGIRMQVVAALEANRIQDLPTEEDISVCGLVYDALGKAVAEVIRQRRELKEAVVEARVKLQDVVAEFGKGLDE